MNDLNKRIAKVLGWTEVGIGLSLKPCGWNPQGQVQEIPDWSSDLNSMHGLEANLTDMEKYHYIFELGQELVEDSAYSGLATVQQVWPCLHATAAQRAEAWLKIKEHL